MVTRVRQRLVREREQRQGRKVDPALAHRTLLLRGYDTLSERAKARLQTVFTETLHAFANGRRRMSSLTNSRSLWSVKGSF